MIQQHLAMQALSSSEDKVEKEKMKQNTQKRSPSSQDKLQLTSAMGLSRDK